MNKMKNLNELRVYFFGKRIIAMYFLVFFLSSSATYAEASVPVKTITGVVLDDATGDPIPGVNIVVKGTKKGTSTDFDGNFTLTVADDATFLVVSYLGYKTKQVSVGNGGKLIIRIMECM